MPNEKKKLLILSILDMLKKKTDRDHPMRYIPIIDELKASYGLSATRKSIQHNLNDLQEAGYPLKFSHGWYYEHEFTAAELDRMVDSVALDVMIPAARKKQLIASLTELGGIWYSPRLFTLLNHPVNSQTAAILEKLCNHIREQRQVSFRYADYDVDGLLHTRRGENGRSIQFKVNPYKLVCIGKDYYLLCNVEGSEGIAAFRLDRIQDIRLLKSAAVSFRQNSDDLSGDAINDFCAVRPEASGARTRKYVIRLERAIVNDAIDWFGFDLQFEKSSENSTQITVKADPALVHAWLERFEGHSTLVRGNLQQPEPAPQTADARQSGADEA